MIEIRDARLADASTIAAVYNESVVARDSTMQLETVAVSSIEEDLRALGTREAMLVGVDDDILGFGRLKRYSDRGGYRFTAETSVYLRRERRREGIGTMVQEALIERARRYDYHHLVAKLWADNESSRALHRKFDYELVGIQQEIGFVEGQWRDVAILQKVLPSVADHR